MINGEDITEWEIAGDYYEEKDADCKREKQAFAEEKSKKLINEIVYSGAGKNFLQRRGK
jgi:hypothetical protein